MNSVVVVGSINIDMVMTTEKLPKIGETILGKDMNYYMGGKGSNQAVAAARIGAPVKLFASIGEDTFGDKALKHLEEEGIDTSLITVEPNIFTGLASIFSIDTDNSIVVLPGANMLLEVDATFGEHLEENDVVLAQLEVPMAAIKNAFEIAQEKGCTTILNPAPYNGEFLEFIDLIDVVTPNETEFEGMIGKDLDSENLEEEMIRWSNEYQTDLILTRGSEGVSYVKENKVYTIDAHDVEVQDTTGAGDTFNGILASLLAQEATLDEAVIQANLGAALSTTKLGAQTGMPTADELLSEK